VKAANAARLIELRAQLAAGDREPQPPRHPAQVLLGAIAASDDVMRELQRSLEQGQLTADLIRAFGEWVDRAGRLAKMALDSQTDERWVRAQEGVAQAQAARLIRAMDRVLNDPRVIISGDPRQIVLDAVRAEDLVPEPSEQLVLSG
jgi:hypothetical protein